MTISIKQARELADMLPDELSCEGSRQRLLCLVEILRLLTDRHHVLSNADIRAILHERFDEACAPAENTIGADLRAIRDSGCFDLDVHITPSGAWCESRSLSPAKVRMLLNAVQASRFLTAEQNADLQESLFGLVSRHQEEDLEGQVLVERRTRRSYQEVFENCDTIARALRKKRKLEFRYAYNDFAGTPVMLESDAGETLRVETPIALLFAANNYYLESYADTPWRHGVHVMHSRLDRMFDVRVSDEPASETPEVLEARSNAEQRMCESFDMMNGVARTLFLRVRADLTNLMYDRFGFDLKFAQFDGELGDVSTTGLTCVRLEVSSTFFRWLSAAGDGIVIECPPSELAIHSGPWAELLQGVDYAGICADYEASVSEYLAFLDRARSAYI